MCNYMPHHKFSSSYYVYTKRGFQVCEMLLHMHVFRTYFIKELNIN